MYHKVVDTAGSRPVADGGEGRLRHANCGEGIPVPGQGGQAGADR